MPALVTRKRSANLVGPSHVWPAQPAIERLHCMRLEPRCDGVADSPSSEVVSDGVAVAVEQPEEPCGQRDEIGLDDPQPAIITGVKGVASVVRRFGHECHGV